MTDSERNKSLRLTRTKSRNTREVVSIHRRSELPGVEIRSLKDSARTFHFYSTELQLFAPISWRGELWHRRRKVVMEPGTLLCAHPGEVYSCRRVIAQGAANFLAIDSSVFREHLSGLPLSKLQLRGFTKMSKLLEEKLRQVFRVIRPSSTTREVQTAMVEFIELMAAELLEETSDGATSIDAAQRNADRVRECLHGDATATPELSALAKQAEVSRFRVLRTFKLRYGLPPHAYLLSVRVALAQKALREGHQPAQVAAQYGFFDQSHLTRHFKRFLGVTPAQYARLGAHSCVPSRADLVAEVARNAPQRSNSGPCSFQACEF